MGQNLSNNSYVNLSTVGSAGDNSDSVVCHTDLSTCCSGGQGVHRGDWYFPNGTRLQFSGDIREARGAQKVFIRHTSGTHETTGIYRCDVPTNAVHYEEDTSVRDTVYVGLYPPDGGNGRVAVTYHNPTLAGNISVYGVTLTVNSDLNGPNPQFTLTCISTGGPATTVTWTRDSATVTEGTETVLDDLVTAQYTHTLTVYGRVGGLYTCTVVNNKPYTASANITLQGTIY